MKKTMTKQLKLAIVLLVTVASMGVNAQKKTTAKPSKSATESKTAKPTKQETMDWIGGKMKENLAGTLGDFRHFVSYSNGIFVYKKEAKMNEWYFTTIDLNTVKGMNSEYSKDFYVTGKKLVNTVLEGKEYGTEKDFLSISGPNYNDYSAPFNFTADQALVERLKKAFATLIEYNATQKGADEKF
ncbi:initiator RepB protein [Chryseobacterium sp. StRB126]|nr:initiator RepB protein [Chryseobacterium sp. StRB126]